MKNDFSIIGNSEMLNEEQQRVLLNFLLHILKDTKSIQVKCDCSHEELYCQVCDLIRDLRISSIAEDYNINDPATWKVKVDFLYPLRNLLNIQWGKE